VNVSCSFSSKKLSFIIIIYPFVHKYVILLLLYITICTWHLYLYNDNYNVERCVGEKLNYISSCHEKTFVTKITRKLWVCKLARLCRVTCLCHNLIFLEKLIIRFILSYFYSETSPYFSHFMKNSERIPIFHQWYQFSQSKMCNNYSDNLIWSCIYYLE